MVCAGGQMRAAGARLGVCGTHRRYAAAVKDAPVRWRSCERQARLLRCKYSAVVDHPPRFPLLGQPLDAAVKARLRDVIAGRRVTEAELRKLFEEGRGCSLIVSGQLRRSEQRLTELSRDPASSFVEIASALRRVHGLRNDLDELHALLAELEEHARAYRGAWIADNRRSTRVPSRAP